MKYLQHRTPLTIRSCNPILIEHHEQAPTDTSWQEQIGLCLYPPKACYPSHFFINQALEYNVLLIGMEVAREAVPKNLEVYDDPMLILNKVRRECEVQHEGLIPYYEAVSRMAREFRNFYIGYLPCH